MRLPLALAALFLLCAHSWYPYSCCSDKDCFELPEKAVSVTRTGYLVRLNVDGSPISLHIKQDEAKPSEDEHFHICLVPSETEGLIARCFFAPPMGA
jgi:hypothetical protein